MLYAPAWSPDGEHLAYSDKEGKVYVLNVKTKRKREIADEPQGQVFGYTWSPNGGYLAFDLSHRNGFSSIYIYSQQDNRLRQITSELFNDFSPAWDPEDQGRSAIFGLHAFRSRPPGRSAPRPTAACPPTPSCAATGTPDDHDEASQRR